MRYVILSDGFKLQIQPCMNKKEFSSSGAYKYLSYQQYEILCESYEDIRCFEKSYRQETLTQEEWNEWAQSFIEAFKFRENRRKQYQI